MERRGLFLGAAAAFVASGDSYFGSVRQSNAGPRAGYFPNVALRTHEDKSVLFYDDLIAGKFVLINFMYTGCGEICPGMTANLVEVQRLLSERVGRVAKLVGKADGASPVRDVREFKPRVQDFAHQVGYGTCPSHRRDVG